MSRGKSLFIPILTVCLAGCITVPQWKPVTDRQKVAVAAIVNPKADQIHLGLTVFGNSFNYVDVGFDINKEINQIVRDQLAKSDRYDFVDMPVEPKIFADATCFWNMGWSFNSLCKPLADQLVQDAKGRGIDYIIGIIDVRSAIGGAVGWGLFQHRGGCYSAYVNYFVFVLDARTGVTETSTSYLGYRRVEGIEWDAAWSAISDAKHAEIISDFKSIAREDIPWTLTALGIVPGNAKPSDYGISECRPYMGG